MRMRTGAASIALVAMTSLASAHAAPVIDQAVNQFDLPAQDLSTSLRLVGKISGRNIIIATGAVEGKRAPSLKGAFVADEAIARLLSGTGVVARFTVDAALIGGSSPGQMSKSDAETTEITVTGTRIRGAHPASPVISLSRSDMVNAGETNLGDVVRNIPQSFAGGQNPNVLQSSGGRGNDNLNSASTINLRGLGASATLTLLNGHRVSYDGASQAVDVSSIPVAAIERLEIVADGASALYGSDAVGGVANIILRKDFSGIEADARMGGATDGGDFQQQYDIVTGRKWDSGGFIATYNFERDTQIDAGQRSITTDLNYSTTLLPSTKQHSGIISGHQDIGVDVSVAIDATFDHRDNADNFAVSLSAPAKDTGLLRKQSTTAYSIAPRIEWRGPYRWVFTLSGVYGWDKSTYTSADTSGGVVTDQVPGHYTNISKIVEASAEGPVVELPGGAIRLALGAGHRNISLANFADLFEAGSSTILEASTHRRSSNYGYGEIFVPVVEPMLQIPGIERLEATAALRYESYGELGNVATPKFGLVYSPVPDVTLRGTWGQSFKTPTLYDQYGGYVTELYAPSDVGSADAPTGSSILYAAGSNPKLTSERATSWTAGLKISPHQIPGLSFEGGFFDIKYRDRISSAGVQLSGALSNPLYSQLITRNPSPGLVNSVITGGEGGLLNLTAEDFDPSNVFAFIDDRNRNISREKIAGVDLAVDFRRDLGNDRSFNVTGSASYLHSTERLIAGSPVAQVSGTVYNPPHWRARGGGTFTDHGFTATAFLNYIGSVTDNSAEPARQVRAMTTLDTVLRVISPGQQGALRGLSMTIAVSNVFDAKPGRIRVLVPFFPAYDSTNYSAVGRLVSVTLSKRL